VHASRACGEARPLEIGGELSPYRAASTAIAAPKLRFVDASDSFDVRAMTTR
jgi:hypothetical protein